MKRYHVIFGDMGYIASYDCYASSEKEAINKAVTYFGTRTSSWYNGGDPHAIDIDDKKYNSFIKDYARNKWYDGKEYYSTSY